MDRKQKSRCPPAYRATRADKEKDKKEGVESKGAVAVKDGGMDGSKERRIRCRCLAYHKERRIRRKQRSRCPPAYLIFESKG